MDPFDNIKLHRQQITGLFPRLRTKYCNIAEAEAISLNVTKNIDQAANNMHADNAELRDTVARLRVENKHLRKVNASLSQQKWQRQYGEMSKHSPATSHAATYVQKDTTAVVSHNVSDMGVPIGEKSKHTPATSVSETATSVKNDTTALVSHNISDIAVHMGETSKPTPTASVAATSEHTDTTASGVIDNVSDIERHTREHSPGTFVQKEMAVPAVPDVSDMDTGAAAAVLCSISSSQEKSMGLNTTPLVSSQKGD